MSMFPALQYTGEGTYQIQTILARTMEQFLVSSHNWGGALLDDTKNGYVAD